MGRVGGEGSSTRAKRNGVTEGRRDKVSDGRTSETVRRTGNDTRAARRQGIQMGVWIEGKKRGKENVRATVTYSGNGVASRKLNESTYNVRLVCPRHSWAKTEAGRGGRGTFPVF